MKAGIVTDFLPPLGVLLREYGLCTGEPWPSSVMLSKVAEGVGSQTGTGWDSLPLFPLPPNLQSSLSNPQAMAGLCPHTHEPQSNFMCSLRFSSPGKPLEGSRIWTRMPGSLPTSLCPQTPTTVGLAPHHQMIQPRS